MLNSALSLLLFLTIQVFESISAKPTLASSDGIETAPFVEGGNDINFTSRTKDSTESHAISRRATDNCKMRFNWFQIE